LAKTALLALEDGSLFRGRAIGADGQTVGEVVFNTAITGYQEILTDPSYYKQIVTLTQPHIGNVGANPEDEESARIHAAGLVIRDLPVELSNWRSTSSLQDYLVQNNIVAIADIDTRRLTRLIREHGAQRACLVAGDEIDEQAAVEAARGFAGLKGADLVREVTTGKAYDWRRGSWHLHGVDEDVPADQLKWNVIAYDYGIKRNILRILTDIGCRLTVVPATTPVKEVLGESPDGVFFSNGPGDPEPCDYAIDSIRECINAGVPTFGICLGHQLLGLAGGARTVKMKFGHHGANHPVLDMASGRVMITSQNHGFAVDETSLPDNIQATHRSLFDGTLQGIHHKSSPAFSFQGHPEASPGPHDVRPVFEHFIELMEAQK